MDILNVILVPMTKWDNTVHTAFTVYSSSPGCLRASAGLTLRDAIEFFVREYNVHRKDIGIARPFIPQKVYLRQQGIDM